MLCAASGLLMLRVTALTWARFNSPSTVSASNTRWPSTVTGMGGAARMPWARGEVAASGISRVCAGPAGSAMRLVSCLPSRLSMRTSRVMAQSMAFCRRRLMAPACDQSQSPLCGLRRRLGLSAALKV